MEDPIWHFFPSFFVSLFYLVYNLLQVCVFFNCMLISQFMSIHIIKVWQQSTIYHLEKEGVTTLQLTEYVHKNM